MNQYVQKHKPLFAFVYNKQLENELAGFFDRFGKKNKSPETSKIKITSQQIGEAILYDDYIAITIGIYYKPKHGLSISSSDFSKQHKVELGRWVVYTSSYRMILTEEFFMENFVLYKK